VPICFFAYPLLYLFASLLIPFGAFSVRRVQYDSSHSRSVARVILSTIINYFPDKARVGWSSPSIAHTFFMGFQEK
jgi:hypothetical protein